MTRVVWGVLTLMRQTHFVPHNSARASMEAVLSSDKEE